MLAVAKRFLERLSAAAQADSRAARKAVFLTVLIDDRELALDAKGAVIGNRKFCWHSSRW
jgi:hypothetical protein